MINLLYGDSISDMHVSASNVKVPQRDGSQDFGRFIFALQIVFWGSVSEI